jgi:indolepyruvate ferredoxin oxidoreductase beta subunit
MNDRPISLLVCALGGEGGGVLSEWLVDVAREAGYPAQATSIPGVAQRTGATTYYIEVFPRPAAELGGRKPVFSLNPVPGALDAMVSSELLETARQATNGMPSPDRTLVITSSARTLTTQERVQLGDGRADTEDLLKVVRACSRACRVLDMAGMAREAGTVVSAVMLGAIAGSGLFPFTRGQYEAVVGRCGASAEASLRGFAKAYDACGVHAGTQLANGASQGAGSPPIATAPGRNATGPLAGFEPESLASEGQSARVRPATPHATGKDLPPRQGGAWPAGVQEIVALGVERLTDYQDAGYADLYTRRLRIVLDAERAAGAADFPATRETARWLALWMAFDDIVRVADLKSRASRWERVQREVKARDGDLVKVYDHFKPGAPEFAALLPQRWAAKVIAWDRRRVSRGGLPWAMPLKVGRHSVGGMLALRTLARMKWLRVRGSRFAAEQSMIERWLSRVVDGLQRDPRLGLQVAMCGRLIKGYGTTNERGKENLLHVLEHLAPRGDWQAIAAAREAALADEAGKALDQTLAQFGAPARPVREQPIRFVRKPKGAGTQGKPA